MRQIETLRLTTFEFLAQGLAEEDKIRTFLERFPGYRKTLMLAVVHEKVGQNERNYVGWQWSDVETNPTRLMRLVIEGISKVSLKTRHSTHYLLRDRTAVENALRSQDPF